MVKQGVKLAELSNSLIRKSGVDDGFKANHPITFYLTHQNSNL